MQWVLCTNAFKRVREAASGGMPYPSESTGVIPPNTYLADP